MAKTLFVTDREGNILISNHYTAFALGMSLEELQKSNVKDLVNGEYYDHSTTLEAIKKKKIVSRPLTTRMGICVLSTSTPLFNDKGEVYLVVTSTDPEQLEEYVSTKPMKNQRRSSESERGELFNEPNDHFGVVAESKATRNILKACNQIAQSNCYFRELRFYS